MADSVPIPDDVRNDPGRSSAKARTARMLIADAADARNERRFICPYAIQRNRALTAARREHYDKDTTVAKARDILPCVGIRLSNPRSSFKDVLRYRETSSIRRWCSGAQAVLSAGTSLPREWSPARGRHWRHQLHPLY